MTIRAKRIPAVRLRLVMLSGSSCCQACPDTWQLTIINFLININNCYIKNFVVFFLFPLILFQARFTNPLLFKIEMVQVIFTSFNSAATISYLFHQCLTSSHSAAIYFLFVPGYIYQFNPLLFVFIFFLFYSRLYYQF